MIRTLHIAIVVIVLAIGGLVIETWLSARRGAAELASTVAAQNQTLQQAVAREEQRAAELTSAVASIAAQKRQIQTPQQAAAALPSVLPQLPLPLSIHLPEISTSAASPKTSSSQPVPAEVSIPQSDLKPL